MVTHLTNIFEILYITIGTFGVVIFYRLGSGANYRKKICLIDF